MKFKNKKILYICQLSGSVLKVAKCVAGSNKRANFVNFETESLPQDAPEEVVSEKITHAFKKIGFRGEPIIFSLPSNYATCRHLKVPTQNPSEIQKIISLQASTYLPYAASELITAYQVVSTDSEGYAYLNVVIVPKEFIKRYLDIFNQLKPSEFVITLSSFGLSYLFNYIRPQETEPVMVLDIDGVQAELAIIRSKKVVLSRYFKLPAGATAPPAETLFLDELNKTKKAYFEEVSKEKINKVFVFWTGKIYETVFESLSKRMGITFEILPCAKEMGVSQNLMQRLLSLDNSFVNLLGFGLQADIEDALNLMPEDLREVGRKKSSENSRFWSVVSVLAIFTMFGVATVKNLDSKTFYLTQFKNELKKIEKDAKIIERMDKRLRFLENRSGKKALLTDIIYELHQLMQDGMSLNNLNYEDGRLITLSGQASELNSVFGFISKLESSEVFKDFSSKIKYTNKKMMPTGEVIAFEIECARSVK